MNFQATVVSVEVETNWTFCVNNMTDLACPERGRSLVSRKDEKTYPGLQSWGDCADKCSKDKDCEAWVWSQSESKEQKAFNCSTMSYFGGITFDTNAVSGRSNCESRQQIVRLKCVEYGVVSGIQDGKIHENQANWKQCADTCTRDPPCQAREFLRKLETNQLPICQMTFS